MTEHEGPTRRQLDDYLERVAEIIEKHGWFLQGVFPRAGEWGPVFVYTIGLTEFDHPEIIVFGLGYEIAPRILNDLGERVRGGEKFETGKPYDDILADYSCVFIEVANPDTAEEITQARNIYGPDIAALQLVWPDQDGRFPGEEGYSVDPRTQPLLGQAPQE